MLGMFLTCIRSCITFIQLAQTVVDAGAVAHLAQLILNPDGKLKVGRQKSVHLLEYRVMSC